MSSSSETIAAPEHERLLAALRVADPEAQISVARESGQLSISTVLSEQEVMSLFDEMGVEVAPAAGEKQPHGHGGSQCCGGCS